MVGQVGKLGRVLGGFSGGGGGGGPEGYFLLDRELYQLLDEDLFKLKSKLEESEPETP